MNARGERVFSAVLFCLSRGHPLSRVGMANRPRNSFHPENPHYTPIPRMVHFDLLSPGMEPHWDMSLETTTSFGWSNLAGSRTPVASNGLTPTSIRSPGTPTPPCTSWGRMATSGRVTGDEVRVTLGRSDRIRWVNVGWGTRPGRQQSAVVPGPAPKRGR